MEANRITHINILRLPQVMQKTGRGRSALYQMTKDKVFPAPIKLGGARASGWIESEVEAWLEEQVQKSRSHAVKQH